MHRHRGQDGEQRGKLSLPAHGVHNLRNALAAAAVARRLDVPWDAIRAGLASYRGVGRRFEVLGETSDIVVVDDYAHHPTEVRATVAAVRRAFPHRRVVVAFQPHLYSRTREMAGEFGAALAEADVVWLTDVFPAREEPIPGVTGELVVEALEALNRGAEVHYEASLDALGGALVTAARPGDVVVTMGAGSIERTGREVFELLGGEREGSSDA